MKASLSILAATLVYASANAAPPDFSGVWMPETKRTEALPRALDAATSPDPRVKGLPSTKGTL